jgi:hypothetical protein
MHTLISVESIWQSHSSTPICSSLQQSIARAAETLDGHSIDFLGFDYLGLTEIRVDREEMKGGNTNPESTQGKKFFNGPTRSHDNFACFLEERPERPLFAFDHDYLHTRLRDFKHIIWWKHAPATCFISFHQHASFPTDRATASHCQLHLYGTVLIPKALQTHSYPRHFHPVLAAHAAVLQLTGTFSIP